MILLGAGIIGLSVWLVLPRASARPTHRPRLLHKRQGNDAAGVALAMDLLAAALSAGATLPDALEVVARSGATHHGEALAALAARLRAEPAGGWDDLAPTEPALEPVCRVVALIVAAGVPASSLLQTGAQELRRHAVREAQIRAAQLGVRLVLPLGLCALPAFIAVAVVPVVLALARQLL